MQSTYRLVRTSQTAGISKSVEPMTSIQSDAADALHSDVSRFLQHMKAHHRAFYRGPIGAFFWSSAKIAKIAKVPTIAGGQHLGIDVQSSHGLVHKELMKIGFDESGYPNFLI